MGLSSSQARLLSLTARMSDLEYRGQQINQQRLRLASQTEEIATNYTNALNKKKLQVATGVNTQTGAYTYISATAKNLTGYHAVSELQKQMLLKDSAGKIIVDPTTARAFRVNGAGGDNLNGFLRAMGCNVPVTPVNPNINRQIERAIPGGNVTVDPSTTQPPIPPAEPPVPEPSPLSDDQGMITHFTNIFDQLCKGYNSVEDNLLNNSDWLYQQLQNGNAYLEEWNATGGDNGTGAFQSTTTSSNSSFVEVSDEDAINRAEAEYDIKTSQIQTKDKQLELDLKSLDTQHNATQTEVDSVKKVIDKNIESSFKTFSA